MLLLSIPLGTFFGLITWAALRGKGGLLGAALFVLFGALAAMVGALAADAVASAASDAVVALGAGLGAVLACVAGAIGFGGRLLVTRHQRLAPFDGMRGTTVRHFPE